jgi:hypothetical protein
MVCETELDMGNEIVREMKMRRKMEIGREIEMETGREIEMGN